MLQTAIETYQELLNIYTDEIQNLQKEFDKSIIHSQSIPALVINSRIPIFDEYLLNIHYTRYDYKIKKKLMPYILKHIACIDLLTEKDTIEFTKLRPKNKYSENLNSLIQEFIPVTSFVDKNIKNENWREMNLILPSRPTRSNATKQLEKFKKEMKKIEESRDTIRKNIAEMDNLKKCYENIIQELKKNKSV